jgi:DNA-binding Lrp family transcriptional regulator
VDTHTLDEVDWRLLHALQIEPRARWVEIAAVVGIDAATAARRWNRLRDDGIAWVTGHSTRGQVALVEIECELSQLNRVSDSLKRNSLITGLDRTSGSRDLLATVVAPGLNELAEFSSAIGGLDGLRSTRLHVATELMIDSSNWRLRALSPADAARVPRARPPRLRARKDISDDLRSSIERLLWRDGRMSVTAIAEQVGFPVQRVADAIATMRQSGELKLRTDIARDFTGWPIYAWYFLEAPAQTLQRVRVSIGVVPEVRLAMTSAGRYNLILAVWLRRIADVTRFEIALETALEGSRIADRAVVLRIERHLSRLVGPDSRASEVIEA